MIRLFAFWSSHRAELAALLAQHVTLVALSTLAGYVDATGFLMLGGFFVSFMSGNSTRLGVGLIEGTPRPRRPRP